ncbi:phage tail protein [Pantoea agglomerans]|uniref:phage tail protein n=1 Tax=Enterobacter agglomerans TaxID=549 RepID=UPI00289FBF4F|nr:phage tail protein [Pantoea agglomerans]WNK65703.1 phage tail protein [Pantoea agglomerans]
MAEQYYSILTNRGKELEAASSANGSPVIIKDFVIGDGNGMAATPDPARTTLVREVYRQAISKLDVSQEQSNQWVAHLVVPADVGGFTIREVGLLTDAGELYAVANCAAIEKPVSGINVSLQFRLAVNETASIELQVATGDGLFLRQDANLADLNNIAKALENLGLNLVGNWQAVQANGGKHSSGNHRIYLDWGTDGKLHITVDTTDVGELFTTQNPPNAGQTGAYPMTGGYLEEEASATVISNLKTASNGQAIYAPMWRSCIKGRGGDQDFKDGASACFRMVEVVSNYAFAEILVDGFGSVRSFEFRNDGSLHAPSSVYAGQGFIAPDGNLYGPVWGGYANNWVLAQINALNVAINNQLNAMNADRNNCVRATARGGRQHKVGGDWVGDWEAPGGCRVTGFNTNEGGDGRKMGIYYRADYYYTNASGWVQAGDIA